MLTDLRLVAVGDITQKFLVPFYQRGYRWGADEVNALLDDIEAIVCDGRRIASEEGPSESGLLERLADVARERCIERQCKIHVTRPERGVDGGARERVQPVETVGPAADDDQMAEPGTNSLH
ncbi:MAG: DUF262 domain-containing protein [Acidobacteriota bacterium]|nr:DUF262 domain-containing protein [Acidobacteriota bacterium]